MSTILNTRQKYFATCYDEDLNSTGNTWLSFNTSTVCQPKRKFFETNRAKIMFSQFINTSKTRFV